MGKRVSLFVTCLGDQLFPNAGMAVVEVLERLGYSVDFPKDQTCCGQPAFNSGYREEARTVARHFLKTYSTWHAETGLWVLCGDNGRHFNHAAAPNTVSNGIAFGEDIAAADLDVGTELTSDYTTICDNARLNGSGF